MIELLLSDRLVSGALALPSKVQVTRLYKTSSILPIGRLDTFEHLRVFDIRQLFVNDSILILAMCRVVMVTLISRGIAFDSTTWSDLRILPALVPLDRAT